MKQFAATVSDVLTNYRQKLYVTATPKYRVETLTQFKEEMKILKETWEMMGMKQSFEELVKSIID